MEAVITLQDAANLVTFVVPGYFALLVYRALLANSVELQYVRPEYNLPRLVIESLVWSLPIVALTNLPWALLHLHAPSAVNVVYVAALLAVSIGIGWCCAFIRMRPSIDGLAYRLGFSRPDKDFMRAQFRQLAPNESVAVTLKSGEIFSGRPVRSSFYQDGSPREYFFDEVAWYDKATGKWNVRAGGVIINLDEVEYIETP